MSKTKEELASLLDEKIPRDAVSERVVGKNIKLSYLEGWYVIDRLNKVVGQGNWAYEAKPPVKCFETVVKNAQGKEGRGVSYTALVTLAVQIGDRAISFSDIGAGKGIDYGTGLDADESAVKEAVTDGLKRCAKNLGMSMGLALYDKTQENVSDDEETKQTELKKEISPKKGPDPEQPKPDSPKSTNPDDAEKLRTIIRLEVEAASKKGLKAKNGLAATAATKEYFKEVAGVEKLSDVKTEHLNKVLEYVRSFQ